MIKLDLRICGTVVCNDDKWIYDYLGWDAVCPNDVLKAMSDAKGEKLDVYINSPGGNIFVGSEIYSALRAYEPGIAIHITGLAASAASVIACAGKSDISPTAMLMVHNVSSTARGDWRDMKKESETLKTANRAIAAAYCTKTGMSEAEALELMNRETWLNANDAVKLGLVDSIANSLDSNKNNTELIASSFGNYIPRESINKLSALIHEADFLNAKIKYLNLKENVK